MQKAITPISNFFIKTQAKIVPINLKDITIDYSINFDGCSKGNPGPAGAGVALYYKDCEIWTGKQHIEKDATNNYAEYTGLLIGLREAINQNIRELKVYGDSQLVIKQMRGEYKVKSENLYPLYTEAKVLEANFDVIIYEHIYRKYNARADQLANEALDDYLKSQSLNLDDLKLSI